MIGLLALFLNAGFTCVVVHPPPARTTHFGAPGRIEPERIDLAYSGSIPFLLEGGYLEMATGGPALSYTIDERFMVEVGVDTVSSEIADSQWTMAFAGGRYTFHFGEGGSVRGAGDVEIGASLGVGGELNCGDGDNLVHDSSCGLDGWSDGIHWSDRLAGGGYVGSGLGLHARWFSFFGRIRVQHTAAQNIQPTVWLSGILGIGFDIMDYFDIYLGGGLGYYGNEVQENGFGLVEFGIALTIPVVPVHGVDGAPS